MKLIVDCFKDVDDPNHPEGRREIVRRGMLARLADDLADGEISISLHRDLRNKTLDTMRLTRAIHKHEEDRTPFMEMEVETCEKLAYEYCYKILDHWRK
jgi:hypothetical protein